MFEDLSFPQALEAMGAPKFAGVLDQCMLREQLWTEWKGNGCKEFSFWSAQLAGSVLLRRKPQPSGASERGARELCGPPLYTPGA